MYYIGKWFNLYNFGTISQWCQQLTTSHTANVANIADAANTTNAANAANTTDQDSWELTWTEVRHCLLNNRLMKDLIEVQDLAWWGGRVQHHFAGHLHGDH